MKMESKAAKKKQIWKPAPPKDRAPSFVQWNNDIFVSSMKKVDAGIILIVILDFLFYFLSGYLAVLWIQRIQAGIAAFNLPSDVMSLGYNRASQIVSDARTFYLLIIMSFALLLLAVIFLAAILKGIIWAKTTNTKISFQLIARFFVLNLIWMGFWFLIFLLASILVQPALATFVMAAIIGVSLYFTNTLYAIFMKEQKLSSIIIAVRLNVMKIHFFLLPYAVIAALFLTAIKLNSIFKFRYSGAVFSVIMLFYAALVRYYASELAFGAASLQKP